MSKVIDEEEESSVLEIHCEDEIELNGREMMVREFLTLKKNEGSHFMHYEQEKPIPDKLTISRGGTAASENNPYTKKDLNDIRKILGEENSTIEALENKLDDLEEDYTDKQFNAAYEVCFKEYFQDEEKGPQSERLERTEQMIFYEETFGKDVIITVLGNKKIGMGYTRWISQLNKDLHSKRHSAKLKQNGDDIKEGQQNIDKWLQNNPFTDNLLWRVQTHRFSTDVAEEMNAAIRDNKFVVVDDETYNIPEILGELDLSEVIKNSDIKKDLKEKLKKGILGREITYKEGTLGQSVNDAQMRLFKEFYGILEDVILTVHKNSKPSTHEYEVADYYKWGNGISNPKIGCELLGLDYDSQKDKAGDFIKIKLKTTTSIDYEERAAIRNAIEESNDLNILLAIYWTIRSSPNKQVDPKGDLLSILDKMDELHGPLGIFREAFYHLAKKSLRDWYDGGINIEYSSLERIIKLLMLQKDIIILSSEGHFDSVNEKEAVKIFYDKVIGQLKGLPAKLIDVRYSKRKVEVISFLTDYVKVPTEHGEERGLAWLGSNLLGMGEEYLRSSKTKFSSITSYLNLLVACHLIDFDQFLTSEGQLFKKDLDLENFKRNARKFVYKKLRKYGMLEMLYPSFCEYKYRGNLGGRNNKLLFNLVVDTLVALNRVHRKIDLGEYINSHSKGTFSLTDLSGLVMGDNEPNTRQFFSVILQSGLPLSKLQTQQIIACLEYILNLDKVSNLPTSIKFPFTKVIYNFKKYKKYAPLTTALSGVASTHSAYFNPLDSKTYQVFELMKITNGFDPLGCIFYERDQTTDLAHWKFPLGVVRAHLTGNSFYWEMYAWIDHSAENIWKNNIEYKFMLAPMLARIHYKEPYVSNELFFNIIIQARMYHLSQITSVREQLTIRQLSDEFSDTKISDYVKIEKFNKMLDLDIRINGNKRLWEGLDGITFGSEGDVFGFEFNSEAFSDFIEKFKKRLDYRFDGEREWFRNTLKQPKLYDRMENLKERLLVAWSLLALDPDNPSIQGEFPGLVKDTRMSPIAYYKWFLGFGDVKANYGFYDKDVGIFRTRSIFEFLSLHDPFL